MHAWYDDITSRIAMRPVWYDENRVPRYSTFSPEDCANIFASECALIEIVCQECLRTFFVCETKRHLNQSLADRLRENIENMTGVCGEPPRHGVRDVKEITSRFHCLAGDTMSSLALRVVEYWKRSHLEWIRDPSLEIGFEPDGQERERIMRGQWTAQ
jgi:hypothetical protein